MWLSKKSTGLDLGSRTLKAVRLKKSGAKVAVDGYFFHDMLTGNDLYPFNCDIPVLLKGIVETQGFKNTNVITCLNDTDILSHEIKLPPMPTDDLKAAIANDIEERFNLLPKDTCLDYVKLSTDETSETKTSVYKIYCAKKDAVQTLLGHLQKAHLNTKVIDSGILAQVEMLRFNDYIEPEKAYALLELGESHTAVSLIADEKVIASNVLTVGFGLINRNLFESLGYPYEQSEALKREIDSAASEVSEDEAHKQLDDALYEILYKVQRMLGLFKISLKSRPIESILVTGGGCQLKHLDKTLEANCGFEAKIVNPFKNLVIYSKKNASDDKIAKIAPYMSTAVGLALRGLG